MKFLVIFWALPMGLFWGWYALSYNDLNFGFLVLSRMVHDVVFELYGKMLGMDPTVIPGFIARACLLDTAILFAIFAFRRRKAIAAWWQGRAQGLPTPSA